MKSMEIKAYNLPKDRLLLGEISAKPNIIFILLFIFGILSFFTLNASYLLGVVLLLVSLFGIVFMPKVTLMEFYDKYLVLYNKASKMDCVVIYYSEVSSWHYSWSASHDYLYIELNDGHVEKLEAFSKTLFESYMNRFLKNKHKKNNK